MHGVVRLGVVRRKERRTNCLNLFLMNVLNVWKERFQLDIADQIVLSCTLECELKSAELY